MNNRLEEIQNEVAKEIGYISYLAYLTELSNNAEFYFEERLLKLNNEVSKRYATEVAKASLEKASEEALYSPISGIVEESITNPENIVLL